MSLKVLIADELSPRAVEIFRERGLEADVRTGLKPDELIAAIAGYDGLAVRSATKVTAVRSSPLDHLTPCFSLSVQVLRSSLASQSTSHGRVMLSKPVRVR